MVDEYIDDEGQVTPDADAKVDAEQGGVGTSLAQIAAALQAAGVSAAREQIDKSFSRDLTDVDIGYHEGLRFLLLKGFEQITALNSCMNHTAAMAAMQAQTITHNRDSDDAFYSGIEKSDSTFHSGLLKAYGLETDNEVLSTVALAKAVDNMLQRLEKIEGAIAAASK